MSIFSFSSIMTKIFHQGSSSSGRSSAGRSGQQVARASGQTVDGEAVLSGMEANAGQKLDLDHVIGSVTGSGQGSSKSTSPMAKALLLLLAAKAASSHMSGTSDSHSGTAPQPSGTSGGEPGAIQSGILKGLPSLESLMERFRRGGQEDKFQSWISPGENQPIQPQELQQALGPDEVDHLQKETGLPRDQLLRELSNVLPQVVDKLTPQGRMPTPEGNARW
jgi:uncharacterized protein YidB (DUF937 family)